MSTSKSIHKGKNIVLWSNFWGAIASQDSATMNFDADLIELAADENGFRRYTKGKKGVSISLSGLMLINEGLIAASIKGIYDELVSVEDDFFELRYEFTATGEYIKIPCLVERFAPNGDGTGYATYSATFKGSGSPTWV